MTDKPARRKKAAAEIWADVLGPQATTSRVEIPWCLECRDWHFPGPHTRLTEEAREAQMRGEPLRGPAGDSGFRFQEPVIHMAEDMLARALEVLGVSSDATVGEVRTAFRAAIMAAHPDRGGSEDQAKRVIAARDELRQRGRI